APPGPGGSGPGGPGGRPPGPPPTKIAQPVTPPESAGSAPAAALPSQGPPGRTVDALRSRLAELGVPESTFRIGPPAGRAWTMEQTDEGWRVGWFDRAFVAPAMFEDVADAAAFLLGKLMLDADRGQGVSGPVHVVPAQHPVGDRLGGQDVGRSSDEAVRPSEEFAAPPDYARTEFASADAGFRASDAFGAADGGYAPDNAFGPPDGFGPGGGGFGPGGGGFGPGSGFGAPDAPAAAADRPDAPGMPDYGQADGEPDLGRHSRHGRHDADHADNGHADNGRTSFAQADAPGYQPEGAFGQPDAGFRQQEGGFGQPDPRSARAGAELERTQFARPDMFRTDSPPSGFDRPDLSRPESRHGDQATTVAQPLPGRTAAAPSGDWPISPLPGEPPLTLFRGKRLVELEPGTEIDRFGEDDGNLVYALGTPFKERSLVPDWVDRPYHAYRVQQPVQVLTGAAIPWFDQPGGGTAYMLPDALGELVALGRLVEVIGRDRPPA
ncbi:TNT domain-containing protein, partial [Actinophytocola sp.]|uniref:TNT domain-containing protein n=1 Tax=Actinophytocola sp. TaxID=1872138 RepID=UPI003D6A57C5